jgi:stress response protein SCP2
MGADTEPLKILSQGGNAPVPAGVIQIIAQWRLLPGTAEPDLAALLVGETGKVAADSDMVFYNQPNHPNGAVSLEVVPGRGVLRVNLTGLPGQVSRIPLAVSMHGTTLDGVADLQLLVVDSAGQPLLRYDVTGGKGLAALVLGELYRRGGGWKLRAIGQGWDTGLAGLAREYGITVDAEPSAAPPVMPMAAPPVMPPAAPPVVPARAPTPVPQSAADLQEQRLPVNLRKQLSLRKQLVGVVLTKKGLSGVRARVMLVLDASGSMAFLYSRGTVGRVVERMAAVGAKLTPDGTLPAWIFATNMARLPDLSIGELPTWIQHHVRSGEAKLLPRKRPLYRPDGTVDMREIGIQNQEPKVMADVIRAVTTAPPGPPVLVLFFSDGGIFLSQQIEKIIRESANLPIFWQFIGLGNADYGVLSRLDTLAGRVVDNAGFFSLDDIDQVGDEELYERLLSEFPSWLRDAAAAGILPA